MDNKEIFIREDNNRKQGRGEDSRRGDNERLIIDNEYLCSKSEWIKKL